MVQPRFVSVLEREKKNILCFAAVITADHGWPRRRIGSIVLAKMVLTLVPYT